MKTHDATLSTTGFVGKKIKSKNITITRPIVIFNVAILLKPDILLRKIQSNKNENNRMSDTKVKAGTMKNTS